jgi:hypothetical protein
MDPPAGKSYLQYIGASGQASAEDDGDAKPVVPRPFDETWAAPREGFIETHADWAIDQKDLESIRTLGEGPEEALAVTLDSAVNGTSLMLILKVGRAHLLLPGDAQWGTWKTALDDPQWRALLKNTTFYKVGHHGSQNATPREFKEEVLDRAQPIRGMVSARPTKK